MQTEKLLKSDLMETLAEAQELLGEARAENAALRAKLGMEPAKAPTMSGLLAATTVGRAALRITRHD